MRSAAMSRLQRLILWGAAALAIASASARQETSIQLPPDNAVSQLKPAPGDEVTRRHCTPCHSTDYIVRQPHLDAQHWDAEVKKMIATYGAHISDADARTITDYLGKNYGSEPGASRP